MRLASPALLLAVLAIPATAQNVVVVMTDDQGYGDFGFAGNPVIRTPNLDALAARSVRYDPFYVHPVCTPTRAALMTGRYPQRTRAFDTWIGRAMLEPAEVTLAEAFGAAGYATGIFGKWHLGDCYPMRPQDQGFDEVLVHRGGGIGQPADPPGGEGRYTDPVLFHNGERYAAKGYCTDVYFDHALAWIRDRHSAGQPFFCYLPTNAPHGPFDDVPEAEYAHYRDADLSSERFPATAGHPTPEAMPADRMARVFAMIENVDHNVGRLVATLDELGCAESTLVVFLVDNGPNGRRYVAGHRGMKSEVYEGGTRSPLLVSWPGTLQPSRVNGPPAADIDLFPTLLEACSVPIPEAAALDGRSIWPVVIGRADSLADRLLVIQAHRGDALVDAHNVAIRTDRWKLLNASGFGNEVAHVEPAWELYDLQADPYELTDLAGEHPDVVRELAAGYGNWARSIRATRENPFDPPRIVLGEPTVGTVTLTRQDWRRHGSSGAWGGRSRGRFWVDVIDPGPYRVDLRFVEGNSPGRAELHCVQGGAVTVVRRAVVPQDAHGMTLRGVTLPPGPGLLECVLFDDQGTSGALQVDVTLER